MIERHIRYLIIALLGALISPPVWALNVQTHRPSTGAVRGFSVFTSETLPKYHLATGLGFNYVHHPFEARVNGAPLQSVVDQFVTTDLLVSYGLFNWIQLNADFPFNLYHNIAPVTGLVPVRDKGGADPGDLMLNVKIRLIDAERNPFLRFGVALVPHLTLPTGRESIFFGDANVTGGVTAVGDVHWFGNRIYANLGARLREDETLGTFGNVPVGDEFLYGAGFQRTVVKKWDLDAIAEISGATSFKDYFGRETSLPLELIVLAQKRWIDRKLITHIGPGFGLTQGYGTPLFRVIAGVSYVFDLKKPEVISAAPESPKLKEFIKLQEQIQFESGKSRILPVSYPVLDKVVEWIGRHPKVTLIQIEGHTDSVGGDALNLRLSEGRAKAVKAYLVGKGVESDRLQAVGFGESQPIADNATPAGRQTNRRVVLRY